MIRFSPDSWLDALLRPVAMLGAESWVYVEIPAPDVRFVALLVLLGSLVALRLFRRTHVPATAPVRPLIALLAWLSASFAVWLQSTGNGRYFMSGMLLVGVVCVGLVAQMPLPARWRVAAALGLLAAQVLVILHTPPWGSWTLAAWDRAPAYGIDVPRAHRVQPAVYLSQSEISFSMIIPAFHPGSRWISGHVVPSMRSQAPDGVRAREAIRSAPGGRIFVVLPALSTGRGAEGKPDDRAVAAIDRLIQRHGLVVVEPNACEFWPSTLLQAMQDHGPLLLGPEGQRLPPAGFWACPLREASAWAGGAAEQAEPKVSQVIARVEQACPRFFPAHTSRRVPVKDGVSLDYPQGEMKLMVRLDGDVYYHYTRALHPVRLGHVDDILSGAVQVDCRQIRGRSGLPWTRSD